MKIKDFGVEMWMNAYENDCTYNLAETCVESLTVEQLLELGGCREQAVADILGMKLTYGAIEGSPRLRMLTRYIWQDVPCAHKTGGLDRLSHDAGVFELPGRPYFIAVLIWDAPDIDGDEPLAGRVSKLVFDYYSQEDTQ